MSRTETQGAVQGWTSEDVETLARFMGWKPPACVPPEERIEDYWHNAHNDPTRACEDSATEGAWNPFLSADDDLMVLERAREVWANGDPDRMYRMIRNLCRSLDAPDSTLGYAILLRYRAGDYARAVLAVLRSTSTDAE